MNLARAPLGVAAFSAMMALPDAPVWADEPSEPNWTPQAAPPSEAGPTRDPTTAVLISALAPVALVGGASALYTAVRFALGGADPAGVNVLPGAAAAVSPLLLSAGYVYAGDPLRGVLVGSGWYGAVVGGFAIGFAAGTLQGGQFVNLAYGALGALVTGVGYTGWALYDVYATTEALGPIRTNGATRSFRTPP
jgi:hypothetical protein